MTFPILPSNTANTGYNLTRSLRFRASASAYLNRTMTTATNNKIWTWSGWVKRGKLGAQQPLFGYINATAQNQHWFGFLANDCFTFYQFIGGVEYANLVSSQVFRDPSAWYHIQVIFDSAQATASNRMIVYVNGIKVTAFSTANYIVQNGGGYINSALNTGLGTFTPYNTNYFDGYLAEVNFIDGQALTPSSFGSTNSTTGVWQPARYTGTYGTNGFYLPFTDNSALTTSSNVGLGKDFSGNGNYWTTNNISITAGVTYDSMTDVPTLTSATAANFAVLNPLATAVPASTYLTQGNLRLYYASTTAWVSAGGTIAVSSGKYYWEVTASNISSSNLIDVGIAPISLVSTFITTNWFVGQGASDYGYYSPGYKLNNSVQTAYGSAYTTGDVIGVALDMTAGTLTFYKNNVSLGVAFTGITGTYTPCVSSEGGEAFCNFGQRPFAYTPPTGFVALNTFNLPTATILKGNKVMDATLYTGTLLSNSVTNAAAFKPDLVWLKSRSAATNNELTDSVRGVTKALVSNSTAAEATDVQGLTAFNTNGFTVGTNTDYNNLAATYVAWQWQAGQGSSSSNTSGTITSTVSVNASAGFSVVTYTGTGANATVGHGLGVAPSFVMFKSRNNTSNWIAYHASLGATKYIHPNLTVAAGTLSTVFNNTAPTSSVFSLGSEATANGSGSTTVAYCWSEIAGFSKIGSYVGNGSADGTFVYCGFRPKFVIIKNADAVESWNILDSVRSDFNLADDLLFPNASAAEAAAAGIDFLSNGFKLRSTSAQSNANGQTQIYAAFAESPFKNSLAR